ncbi:hypothetical protein MGN01_37140 [Methylobacterium gnaphalii]|uniref:Uncharacterized protein n=1 Tax=Methylobacterium gnaphalii TaxID=1010610 RepID=A0A512JPJ6_9HYPH|nr:hypothetical protein MGN01_37140 [Methylobacterium gnaphalii]GLS47696.1 hypothetical protein GCM10007885_05400 [Methylobacterium gnaphalii]
MRAVGSKQPSRRRNQNRRDEDGTGAQPPDGQRHRAMRAAARIAEDRLTASFAPQKAARHLRSFVIPAAQAAPTEETAHTSDA